MKKGHTSHLCLLHHQSELQIQEMELEKEISGWNIFISF